VHTIFLSSKRLIVVVVMDDDDDDLDWSMADDGDEAGEAESVLEFDDTDVSWRISGAREILLDDLHRGVIPLDAELLSAEDAWHNVYASLDAFRLVPFSQFKRQLKAHRKQVAKLAEQSQPQYEAFRHDQATQQQFAAYSNGRPIFAAFPGARLLKADVHDLQDINIDIGTLHQFRPEYAEWTRDEFTRRVYQEVRYWKFVNYLERKRQALLARVTKKADRPQKKRKGGI
jgi:hypothetical protein